MWGEYHPLPYTSKIKEKIIWKFSPADFGWIVLGFYLSVQFASITGPISLFSSVVFSRIHYAMPLGICALLAYGKHPATGLGLVSYLYVILSIRFRRRKFLYRKTHIVEGGDRWS